MVHRNYGYSGYHPSQHFRQEKENKHPAKKSKVKSFLYKLAKWALLAVVAILIVIWLALGDFRFMLTKYPAFSGFPFGSRNYIILFQDNYELRPTGGFISTYGELKFSNGIYKGIAFHDVYGDIDDHDYVEPPLVLSALIEADTYEGHTFRDANFDPDFTKTKDELIEFYRLTNPGDRVDGIIAVDFTFLEKLVGYYEPLEVEGYQLTEANLFETLSIIDSEETGKNISGSIIKKIMKKSMMLPWRIRNVLKTTAQGFEEKHFLATFEKKRLEKAFSKRNWNGALPQSSGGDFLAINDANYSGMKSNRYITRDVVYELDVTNQTDVLGNPIINAKVTVTLSHEGIWNIPLSGLYTGFLRVMVPLGSDVEESGTISEERDDVHVIGELVEIQPGEQVSYTYTYELPEYVWNNETYSLHLHKQPGTLADHYRVVVRMPQGLSITSSQFDVRENVAFYETNLLNDINLSFEVLEDKNPPRVVSQEITNMNEITLIFNENISSKYASNPTNFQVTDMDYKNGEKTDSILVENIRADGSKIILYTSGMSDQFEERYEVMIRDIRDAKGNFIDPNPQTITLVQRIITETEETDG